MIDDTAPKRRRRLAEQHDCPRTSWLRVIQGHCASETSESLDAVFYDGDIYGYSLTAERLSDSKFQIDFGCQAGPTTGDGGTWEVTFEGQSVYEMKN
jgi:hypothetical protein